MDNSNNIKNKPKAFFKGIGIDLLELGEDLV